MREKGRRKELGEGGMSKQRGYSGGPRALRGSELWRRLIIQNIQLYAALLPPFPPLASESERRKRKRGRKLA